MSNLSRTTIISHYIRLVREYGWDGAGIEPEGGEIPLEWCEELLAYIRRLEDVIFLEHEHTMAEFSGPAEDEWGVFHRDTKEQD